MDSIFNFAIEMDEDEFTTSKKGDIMSKKVKTKARTMSPI